MATSKEYIGYVCERLKGDFDVRCKKMFGEYMIYLDDRPALLVCDNTVYVKILPALSRLLQNADKGTPYKGAKEHYILDIEDGELTKAAAETLKNQPPPRGRKAAKNR